MMKQLINKFAKEEKGAPIIEIVILLIMAAVMAAVLFPNLRGAVSSWMNDMIGNINTALTGQDPTAPGAGTAPADVSW